MRAQQEKAEALRTLHQGPDIVVLPNAWDAASAVIFANAGFPAIATTSAGIAATLGYPDGQRVSLDEMVSVVRRIAAAVDCPVTADMEAGYGATVADIIATAQAVIAAGAVGMNLEDAAGAAQRQLIDVAVQIERIRAIREAGTATLIIPLTYVDVFCYASVWRSERGPGRNGCD
jgi:2-methylisocitrate lyase-like PEP mutase family enzyme